MPTTKQRKLAKELLNAAAMDKPPTAGQMLAKVGYSKNLVKQPGRVIEAQGVKDALAEYGLTEELIATSLVSDIKAKKKNRLGELRLGAELLGKLKGNDQQNSINNIVNIFSDDQLKRAAEEYLLSKESLRDM